MLDRIFKIGLLFLGICFLILYYSNSQNGRYKYLDKNATYYDNQKFGIFDTKEGKIYFLEVNGEVTKGDIYWIETSPKGGNHLYDYFDGYQKK